MARIHLIGWSNQAGLSRDLILLHRVLSESAHEIQIDSWSPPSRLRRLWLRLRAGGPVWDLTIFVERTIERWLELSHQSVLIPNPEWFLEGPAHARLDAIWCKTAAARSALADLGPPLRHIGFSTADRRAFPSGGPPRRWRSALHVAGRSRTKGTAQLVEIWCRHPDWPELTVVVWGGGVELPGRLPPNIRLVDRFIPDPELQRLQLECGIHLCPSEVEGFGHTLVEAMSTGAVVLAIDAPPMNEIVTPDRGVLVPGRQFEAMRRGYRYQADGAALERILADLTAWPEARLEETGRAARSWYLRNDQEFRKRLLEEVEMMVAGRSGAATSR